MAPEGDGAPREAAEGQKEVLAVHAHLAEHEHVQLLRNIFAYLELAATASSTYIYYIEETEDYGDYEAVKAAYIPRILEVVELMEANDADVPFEGTLDAVGLLDGLLEQAMEGLNLLGGE